MRIVSAVTAATTAIALGALSVAGCSFNPKSDHAT